jgi:hypothetical protein
MSTTQSRSTIFRNVALIGCAIVLGLPMALVFTHGAILVPMIVAAVLTPFVVLHYLLWGWWLSPRQNVQKPPTD